MPKSLMSKEFLLRRTFGVDPPLEKKHRLMDFAVVRQLPELLEFVFLFDFLPLLN